MTKKQSKPKPSRLARDRDGGKNFDGFSLPPHNIVIIGVDTTHGPDHPLYSALAVRLASGEQELDERLLRSINTIGVQVAVSVRYEVVAEDDERWPARLRGQTAHVLVYGRRRVIHGRRVVDDKFYTGVIGSRDNWQIRCVLQHAKAPQDLVAIVADENMCRRVLDDDEITEGIIRGQSCGYTLDEMAERYHIKRSKAHRLLKRAEGVPAKPKVAKSPRMPASAIKAAVAQLRADPWTDVDISKANLAWLIECVAGRAQLADAPADVRDLLQPGDES